MDKNILALHPTDKGIKAIHLKTGIQGVIVSYLSIKDVFESNNLKISFKQLHSIKVGKTNNIIYANVGVVALITLVTVDTSFRYLITFYKLPYYKGNLDLNEMPKISKIKAIKAAEVKSEDIKDLFDVDQTIPGHMCNLPLLTGVLSNTLIGKHLKSLQTDNRTEMYMRYSPQYKSHEVLLYNSDKRRHYLFNITDSQILSECNILETKIIHLNSKAFIGEREFENIVDSKMSMV